MEYKTAKRMECLPFSGIRAVMEKANKMQQAGEKIIHLEIGRPDFDTPEKIKKAANESLAAGHVFYTSNYGIPKLREAIAKWENENHGTDYEASEVLVTVGVGEATFASMDAFLDPGDEILVPNPVWLNYIHVPSALGAVPVTYSLKEENDYQIDFEEMESKITDKTKMIVVVNPSNPTGGVFSRETLEKLSEIAIKHDLLVIADEIYSQLVYDGYLCAPVGIIQACVRVHQYTVTCASSFVQEAALTALSDCAEDVEAMRKEYQRRKDYVVKALNEIDGISCNNPHGAFYIFVNIKSLGMTSMEVAEYLLDNAKIALVPGSAFGSEGEGYLRISYACSYEDLQEACARIKKAVEELKNK